MLIYNKNKAVQKFQAGGIYLPVTLPNISGGGAPSNTWAPSFGAAPAPRQRQASAPVASGNNPWGAPARNIWDPITPGAPAATQPTTTIPYTPGYNAPARQARPTGGAVTGRAGGGDAAGVGGRSGGITGGAGATTPAKKTLPGSTRSSANTDSRVDRIKMIQRRLGVKDDGLWGAKTQAAFEAMKETQRSLGFTGKDVDGIYGQKTQAALDKKVLDKAANAKKGEEAMSDMADVEAAKKAGQLDGKTAVAASVVADSRSRREVRQDERAKRKAMKASEKERGFASKRIGGIFYCSDS